MTENINGLGYYPPDTVEDFADPSYNIDLNIPDAPKNGNGLFEILASTKKTRRSGPGIFDILNVAKTPRRGPGIFDIVNAKKTPRSKSIFSILDSAEKVKKVLPEANDIVPNIFDIESDPVVSDQDSSTDQSGTLVEPVSDPLSEQTVEEPLQSQISSVNASAGSSTPMLLLIAAALAAYFFQNNSENNENDSKNREKNR